MIKVAAIDDQEFMLYATKVLLSDSAGIEYVGGAKTFEDGLALVDKKRPDVVLADIHLPKRHCITLVKNILKKHPDIKVIAQSISKNALYAYGLFLLGIVGHIDKSQPNALPDLIAHIARGEVCVSIFFGGALVNFMTRARDSHLLDLTADEIEVLYLLIENKSIVNAKERREDFKDSLQKLNIHKATFHRIKDRIFKKLQIETLDELKALLAEYDAL